MDRLSPTAQKPGPRRRRLRPTVTQLAWLRRGLDQAGGKLPLFDHYGQRYDIRTIESCVEHGWAEPWFKNPIKPDWLVCRLTDEGREIAEAGTHDPSPDEIDEHEIGEDELDRREVRVRNLVDDLFA